MDRLSLRREFARAIEPRGSIRHLRSEEGETAITIRARVAQRRPNRVANVQGRLDFVGLSGGAQAAEAQRTVAQVVDVESCRPGSDVLGCEFHHVGDGYGFVFRGAGDGERKAFNRDQALAGDGQGGRLGHELVAGEAQHAGREGDRHPGRQITGGERDLEESGPAAAYGADIVNYTGVGRRGNRPHWQRGEGDKCGHGVAQIASCQTERRAEDEGEDSILHSVVRFDVCSTISTALNLSWREK